MPDSSETLPAPADLNLSRSVMLQRVMALFALLLMGLTWQLWFGFSEFPRIPLLPALPAISPLIFSAIILLLLLDIAFGPAQTGRRRRELLLLAVLLGVTFLLNQHCIQTWSYQFAIMGLIWFFAKPDLAIKLIRLFVISIYCYSAISKLDLHFISGGGLFLLKGLTAGTDLDLSKWPNWLTSTAIATMPLFELMVGIGLLFSRTRKYALAGSFVLHLGLLKALGPFGLNHSNGVLTWNCYFIVQNWFLFRSVPSNQNEKPGRNTFDFAAILTTLLALALPVLNSFGYYDHWPSWAVYTSRQERLTILIDESQREMLPESLQPLLDPPKPLQTWRRVRLGEWSLNELGVPIYPQSRFRLAILQQIQKESPGLNPRVILHHSLDRFSKAGQIEEFSGKEQLDGLTDRYWLLD